MRWLQFLYPILLHLFLFHFLSYCSSSVPLCNHDQSSALLLFKNSFSLNSSASRWCDIYQSSYPKTASWENGTDCCLWDGVTCDTISGYVIGLDLSCSWLQGRFHQNSTLFQLTHLQTLNLAHNDFNWSQMPSHFGGLGTLTYLNLSDSAFDGEIPSKIAQLSKLVSLDLSENFLDERRLRFEPSPWKKLIQNATDLRELVLDGVNMPFIKPSSLSLLMNLSSSLVSLSLEETGLQGNLSDNILCLPNLQKLVLSRNQDLNVQLPKSNWSTPLRYLDLSFAKSIEGNLPDSIGHLRSLNHLALYNFELPGIIPPSFGNLTQLTHLTLDNCQLQAPIPPSFWNLSQLTYLALESNNFSGPIPDVFHQLSKLESLSLSSNNLQGPIPNTMFDLVNLRDLCLSFNNFSGPIPLSLSNFQHLISFDLSHNNLSGQIPNMFHLFSKLESLSLSGNNLQGLIPNSMFDLVNLTDLNLSSNNLSGHVEFHQFSKLKNLQYLDLSNNKFLSISFDDSANYTIPNFDSLSLSGNNLQGPIPNWMFDLVNLTDLSLSSNNLSGHVEFHQFSKLKNLQYLDLSNNKFLSISFDDSANYTIPNFHSLSLSSCNIDSTFPKFLAQLKNIHELDLSNNKIRGRVPKWLNDLGKDFWYSLNLSHNFLTSIPHLSMMNMEYIDLSHNMLQGDLPIPSSGTYFFSVSNNKLTGDISSTICNASSLEVLNLSHNNLTGRIPQCLGNISSLSVLDLQMNHLSGTIPGNFSKENSLETLKFNGNQLEGPLPQSLAQCKQLQILDLGENNIKDIFPSWLDALSELQVLILRANKFYGIIPRFKTKHPFPKLRIFDVSNNSFSGPLPTAYIKNFKGMMNVDKGTSGAQYMEYYSLYSDSVVITMKGFSIELERILTIFTTLDLSNNLFEGEIPKVIGELYSLKGLNLSHNRINGTIPQSLGNLISLEWLDLSSNKLKGEIPMALTNLTFLSLLNLSQNQLEGIIPQGKQFNTFPNESYAGNSKLCGIPLSRKCNKDEAQPPSSSNLEHEEEESGFGWKAVALGYGCGMVFGMLLGYVVFSTGKPEWLVIIFGGETNKMMRRRIRNRSRANPNHGRRN